MNPMEISKTGGEASEQSRTLLEQAMASVPVAVLIADERGRVMWLNDAARRLAPPLPDGTDPPLAVDVLGLDPAESRILLPAPFPAPSDAWASVRVESMHPPHRSLLVRRQALDSAEGKRLAVLSVAANHTSPHNLAYALEASEERFGTLFREASDPTLILSLDGDILSVNDAFESGTGLHSEQLFHGEKDWGDFVVAEDVPALRKTLDRCRRAQGNESCEFRMQPHNGEVTWFEQRITVLHDEHGQPKGFLAVCRNIHARKQLEFELRQEAEEMQQQNIRAQVLVERLTEFFSETSALPADLDGYLDGICEILERMYSPSLILISTLQGHQTYRAAEGVQPPLDASGRMIGIPSAMCRHMMTTGSPFITNELPDDPVSHQDEFSRGLALKTCFGTPLRDATGTLRGALSLLDRAPREPDSLDVELITVASLQIAARLRSEEQEEAQRDLESHLRQCQKMEALGMLAGGVAHDFNNILSGILGISSFLLTKADPGTPLHHDLHIIESSAERASHLTRQLLAFARRRHFPKEPVSLNDVVDLTLGILFRSLVKDVHLTFHRDADLPCVLGDAGQLGQVVMNICLNAAESIADREGTITITTDQSVPPDHLSILAANVAPRGQSFLRLQIADTGAGMSEDVKNHVFDPFFTTKSGTGGSGLGLAIVYGIVTNHGGDIIVESSKGQGAAFHVYLPIHTGEGVVLAARPVADLTGTETILVVDDELIIRQMATEVLSDSGYTVIAVESGDAAVQQFPSLQGTIDLVLLDMVMPGRDGETTFHDLRSIEPDLPILLTSGFAQEEVTDQLLSQGARGLVYKPYKSETLLLHIRDALQTDPLPDPQT